MKEPKKMIISQNFLNQSKKKEIDPPMIIWKNNYSQM